MSATIRVPELGESITEALIVRWLKDDGASVRADEPVVELETDKSALEVVAETAGRLSIREPAGARVRVGTVIGEITDAVGTPAAPREPDARPEREPAGPSERPRESATPRPTAPAAERVGAGREGGRPSGDGNGARGAQVVAVPTDARTSRPAAPVRDTSDDDVTRVPMSELRRTIARRLVEAQQQAAILTTFNEIDVGELQALRARSRERFRERHGVDPRSLTDLIGGLLGGR